MHNLSEPRRKRSLRLSPWDYSSPGCYFVTICTRNNDLHFGKIAEFSVCLSLLGQVAYDHWRRIDQHVPNVSVDEFVIMPNHLHGILIIRRCDEGSTLHSETAVGAVHATPLRNVSDVRRISQRMSIISPKAGSLGTLIRSYKSSVTRWARKHGFQHFVWQRGYYDHIIRDETDLARISQYIRNNPMEWALDPCHLD